MATIDVTGLSKRFGRVSAISGLDLHLDEGEFVALVGTSGCGKSTTLRLIAGLEQPDTGRVRLAGRDCTDAPPGARNLAMVFQSGALYQHLTVYGNLAFPLRDKQLSEQELDGRVRTVAGLLDIAPLLHRKAKELSGGQRQRVALGRALVRDADAYLLDEPFSALDTPLRLRLCEELATLQRRRPRTTVHVTHDQNEAMLLADRIMVLDGGRVQQVGTPDDLYERPRNCFVAGFLGSPGMNFLPLRCAGPADDCRLTAPGLNLPVPPGFRAEALAEAQATGGVVAGIRPQALTLLTEGCCWAFEIRVERVDWNGQSSHLHGRLVRELGTALTVTAPGNLRALCGHTVQVGAAAVDIHLFGAASGARILPG